MVSSSCRVVCQVLLILFSLVSLLMGTMPLVLGSWIMSKDKNRGVRGLDGFQTHYFITGFAMVFIGLGLVMVTAGLSGLYGGSSRKKWALSVCAGFIFILIMAGLVFGILPLFMKDRMGLYIVRVYVEIYGLYVADGQDAVLEFTLRMVHNLFHCCGVTGVPLMEGACPRPTQFLERIVMPSCPVAIALHFEHKAPFFVAFFVIMGVFWVIPIFCCHLLSKKPSPTVPSPHYVPLMNVAWISTPAPPLAPPPANPPPYAQASAAPPWTLPDYDDSLCAADTFVLKGPA